jgi:hypothetical protein
MVIFWVTDNNALSLNLPFSKQKLQISSLTSLWINYFLWGSSLHSNSCQACPTPEKRLIPYWDVPARMCHLFTAAIHTNKLVLNILASPLLLVRPNSGVNTVEAPWMMIQKNHRKVSLEKIFPCLSSLRMVKMWDCYIIMKVCIIICGALNTSHL